MSEITRVYQFRIYNTAGGAVETTFADADIVKDFIPSFGWTTPRPLEGRVENIPSVIRIVDTSEQVTAILSGADGRADLIGRRWDIRINEDGGGLAIVASGRLTSITMAEGVAAFDFHLADERWREDADVLTTGSTTQILPSGTISAFKDFDAAATMTLQVVGVPDVNNLILTPVDPVLVTPEVIEWLENDMGFNLTFLTGETPFEYTKISLGGGDRDILTFASSLYQGILGNLREIAENGSPRDLQYIYVSWAGHGKNVDDLITGAFIHAPAAPTSEWTPLHVGGVAGQDPFDWIKDQYDTLGVSYETAAFTAYDVAINVNGLLAHPRIPVIHIRAVKPEKLRDVVEKICKMYGIVPFINSAGEVAPRFVTNLQAIDPATLTEITAAKATPPHPTWSHISGEIVTVLQAKYSYIKTVDDGLSRLGFKSPLDRLFVQEMPLFEITHDRVAQLGRHVLKLDLTFISESIDAIGLYLQQGVEILDRYGDGPIKGSFRALSAASGVEAGDYVTLTLSSYPNVGIQARGGTRIVQVMSREVETGYTFTYIDAGPNQSALAAPGVAIAKNVTDGNHAVTVTVSGLTADATYEVQLKIGGAPWNTVAVGTANEAIDIGNLPSATVIQARGMESAPGRIKSAYSAAVNVTLDTLTAPNGLVVGALAGDRGTGTWTNGETIYDIEVLLDGTRVAVLVAGTTSYTLTGLALNTLFNGPGMAVRHIDRYGGLGASDTDDFTTTGVATTLTQPFATRILAGGVKV